MKISIFYFLLGILAGIVGAAQPGINSILDQKLGSALLASTISFMVGTIFLLILSFSLKILPIPLKAFTQAPWWAYLGGLLGAFFVLVSVILAPKVGAVTLMGLLLTGQILASLLYDHFGILGYPVHPISWWRILGLILMGIGVYLTHRF
ncbi:MAG: bacterial/archaeal transporter family-2 protein [Desulfonauticus sp.]|jgi:transporter family-2 protein|nr:bacterial/archaeal transporter family-2 protein [Desulfonauticus sp.]